MPIRFRAELASDGKSATGITVPDEVLETLGGGRRPAVAVTVNGYTYASTVGSMGGVAKIPVSAAVRAAAGLRAGDIVDVALELDTEPRTVEVPADLAEALAGHPRAREFFAGLSPSRQRAFVTRIAEAKQAATRERRVARAIELLDAQQPEW